MTTYFQFLAILEECHMHCVCNKSESQSCLFSIIMCFVFGLMQSDVLHRSCRVCKPGLYNDVHRSLGVYINLFLLCVLLLLYCTCVCIQRTLF